MAPGRIAGVNLVLLLTLGAIWGVSFMFITVGLEGVTPLWLAAVRFYIAAPALLAIALLRGADVVPRTGAQWTAIGVAGLFNIGLYHALLFWGQARFHNPVIGAVIVGLNPVLTTVASRVVLEDDRVGWGGLLGLGMGLAGVVVLATLREGDLLDAAGVGQLAAFLGVAAFALGSTLVRRTKHRMDVFAFTGWQMLGGGVLLHLGAVATEGGGSAVWNVRTVTALLYMAIVAGALAFVMYFTLLERLGPIRTNLVSHIAPVFAAIAGFMALGQPFELRTVLAFALIAGGFALVARPAPAPRSTAPVP